MDKLKSETIFALSTFFASSALAVIRVSGDKCKKVVLTLCNLSKVKPRHAYFCELKDCNGDLIDKCILIFFKSPNSYTGEDLLEIQTHGSTAIIERILNELKTLDGLRMAKPGEFSLRAFRNKKQSAIYFEGLNNLILAETEKQRIIAIKQTFGESENLCKKWERVLIQSLAYVDASIEFSEEDDVDLVAVEENLNKLKKEITEHLEKTKYITQIKLGIKVLIFGPPNAGKSSLFNLLCKEEKVIVSPIKGTTRDQISADISLHGNKLTLIDSAGIRYSSNQIEKKGIEKTYESLKELQKFILVLSPDSFNNRNILAINQVLTELNKKELIIVFNKSDLKGSKNKFENWNSKIKLLKKFKQITISCKKKGDLNQILKKTTDFIHKKLINIDSLIDDDYFFTEKRHIECMELILEDISNALVNFDSLEICADFIKEALKKTNDFYGKYSEDDKLEHIFSNFCIGK